LQAANTEQVVLTVVEVADVLVVVDHVPVVGVVAMASPKAAKNASFEGLFLISVLEYRNCGKAWKIPKIGGILEIFCIL